MKKTSTENIKPSRIKESLYLLALCSAGSLLAPSVNANQIANSSIDLKKDVESIQQKNFKNKNNLESPLEDSLDEKGNTQKIVSEKTIILKNVSISGNKKIPSKNLSKYYEGLIGKDVTFSNISDVALKIQSLYREKGFITSRVVIPKQDLLSLFPHSFFDQIIQG